MKEESVPTATPIPGYVTSKRRLFQIVGIAIAAMFVVGMMYRWNFDGGFSPNRGEWGEFGDFFGGTLNPILSFLSLIALLYTINNQNVAIDQTQRDLEISREELRLTRAELEKSSVALDAQSKTSAKENFEATFFRLLSKVDDVVNNINFGGERRGKTAINYLWDDQVSNRLNSNNSLFMDKPNEIIKLYLDFSMKFEVYLSPYFRTLYHVFRFIDRSTFTAPEKAMYANIARAQLTLIELSLISLNGVIHPEGKDGFKPLIEKYGILKHLARHSMPTCTHHFFDQYSISAFQSFDERTLSETPEAPVP